MENNLILDYLKAVKEFAKGSLPLDELKKIKASYKEFIKDKTHVIDIKEEDVDEAVKDFNLALDDLRKDGENSIKSLSDQILEIKLKKNIDKAEKEKLIKPLKEQLGKALIVKKQNKEAVKTLVKKASLVSNAYAKEHYRYVKSIESVNKKKAKEEYKVKRKEALALKKERLANVNGKERTYIHNEHRANMGDIRRSFHEEYYRAKNAIHKSFAYRFVKLKTITNMRMGLRNNILSRLENFSYKFKLSTFLLKYALYFVILIFFIVCVIIAAKQGNMLLTDRTIQTILTQSSTKIFFALGVAGLILLGGTDLSVGRMTGMAATFSCLFLSQLVYETNIGTFDMRFNAILAGILGIIVCVASTTLFSALAGFFTAKFKMHPFITTLSTQLLIYGLMMVCFSQVPAFTMNSEIKNAIAGEDGWLLCIYSLIAIIIVWVIWNKTKFGKSMYAVGDNKEAAKVSGINVFKVTLLVFVMAGVLYGLGGFLEGARIGNANPSTALGTELDAIAACVIGGVSFSGGKGKVSGVVIGTIIFSMLTYCLTFIGLDINYQFIFKGVIILSAVCLDSLKSLKKQ